MTNIKPMGVSGIQHLVERAYRESGEFQYLRELLMNALEAGATQISFGPEWQAVETRGVYRLMVADNGCGMTPEELLKFLNTFGGGGKPIGDAHENYGVGAKTSLLPWNHLGVVVLSWTKSNPEGAMVWLARNQATGEYGATSFDTPEGYEEVVRPFGEWAECRPALIGETGTVVICLGNSGSENTFLGKDGDGDIKGITRYLNKRIWKIPKGVEITVQELRSQKPGTWPRSLEEASGPASKAPTDHPDRRWNKRTVRGAKSLVVKPGKSGKLANTGTVRLNDGTEIDWFLWAGDRSAVHSYAYKGGYIAALYKNELYDAQQHVSHFRSFGVSQSEVRKNLTLIARPQLTNGSFGVYPDTARNSLKIQGTKRAGESLPWAEWAQEFADQLPQAIRDALAKAGPANTGTLHDPKWRTRLVDRFSARWKTLRFKKNSAGQHRINPTQAMGPQGGGTGNGGSSSHKGGGTSQGHRGPQRGEPVLAAVSSPNGTVQARSLRAKGGLPTWEWVTAAEVDESEKYAAAWCPPSAANPNGAIQMARDFSLFVEVKAFWRNQYPDHYADKIGTIVEQVYGETMVARLAHSEHLVSDARWGRSRVEDELRSPPALTMAVLGLLSEDYLISQRLKGLGVRRKSKTKAAS